MPAKAGLARSDPAVAAAPIYFDQDIEVHARTARLGRSSATFLLEIHPAGDDRLLASGEVVWVNSDQATNKSAPLPAAFVEKILAKEGDRVATR